MHNEDLVKAFQKFAAAPADLLQGAWLVARVIKPDTQLPSIESGIKDLLAEARKESAVDVVSFLSASGFAGATEYYRAENSSIEYVLSARRGIPISLAVLVITLAQRLGQKAAGINYPGHFLVSVDERIADPFQMRYLANDELVAARRQLPENTVGWPQASNIDIVLRMLNNLLAMAQQQQNYERALDITACQLELVSDGFALLLERADLWLKSGVASMARYELERAIALAPDAATRKRVEQRYAALPAGPGSVH